VLGDIIKHQRTNVVFIKATDGGKKLEKKLCFVNDQSGLCGVDLTFDPKHLEFYMPSDLGSAQRTPYSLSSGGDALSAL